MTSIMGSSERDPVSGSEQNQRPLTVPLDWWLEALSNQTPINPEPVSLGVRALRRIAQIRDELRAMGPITEVSGKRERRRAENLLDGVVRAARSGKFFQDGVRHPRVVAAHYWYYYKPDIAEEDQKREGETAERYKELGNSFADSVAKGCLERQRQIGVYVNNKPDLDRYLSDVPLDMRDIYRFSVTAHFVTSMIDVAGRFGTRPPHVFALPQDLQI